VGHNCRNVAFLLCVFALQGSAHALQWTRLIDSRVNYPGVGQFTNFADAPVFDGTDIAFKGTTGSISGIFRYSTVTNQLQEVAVIGTPMPNSTTTFGLLGEPVINQGDIAFDGAQNSGTLALSGVYEQASSTAPLSRVVDSTVSLPYVAFSGINPSYSTTERPSVDAGVVAFDVSSGLNGIYTSNGSSYNLIASQASQIPGDSKDFLFTTKPSISDGVLVFEGTRGSGSTSTEDGIYAWQNGTIRTVINDATTLPGGYTNEGTVDRYLTANEPAIQFYGLNAAGTGLAVYVEFPAGQIRRVYADGDPMPGDPGAKIEGDGYQAYDAGVGVYELTASDGSFGLYEDNGNGLLSPVITDGVFDGRQLSSLHIVAGSFSDNEIAVEATFTNSTSGLYSITVPEPTSTVFMFIILFTGGFIRSKKIGIPQGKQMRAAFFSRTP
jgi:hypothetical protein